MFFTTNDAVKQFCSRFVAVQVLSSLTNKVIGFSVIVYHEIV
jgi:hypothetical protein